MLFDLHIHSKYSRATGKDLDLKNLEKYAKIKGIDLLGTGDFTHPKWIEEIKNNLREDNGILYSKTNFPFLLQTEISLMYSQGGKGRRVHNIILAPNLETVKQISETLGKKGRLDYDGRPIFNISCIELVDMMRKISEDIEIIPAHAWTPWFGVFGSMTGFDSIEEAFGDNAKYIHAIETGLSCYDKETEVLTDSGWKHIDKVGYKDYICTLNMKNNNIEYQKPEKVHSYPYKGKMYKLKTKRIDLLVTPNHNLMYSGCDFRKPPQFKLKEAEFLFGKSKRFKKDGIWTGTNEQLFTLPVVKIKHGSRFYSGLRDKKEKKLPMEAWLKFFGLWIAEGWTTRGKDGDYNVCISNLDKDIIHEMEDILQGFGFNTFWSDKTHTLRVRDFQLFNYLKQFGKCHEKFVPNEVKNLSKDLLDLFLKYYIKGDGHIYGRTMKGMSATTSSVRLRDDLQEIALKIGMSAYYKLDKKKGSLFNSPSNKKTYAQREDTWVIYFIRKNVHTVLPSTIMKRNYTEAWIDFDGYVFCVTVPNHVIYVRRNGIPVWCGNSDPEMNWRLSKLDNINLVSFSDLHSYWPWRIGREATEFNVKLNYKSVLNAIRTGEGLKGTIEVDPAYGKYHWDGHRNCNIRIDPEKVKDKICSVCGKQLTIGVLRRVNELADREYGFKPKNAKEFKRIIPLSEIISNVISKGIATKGVWDVYNKLIQTFGNEMNILLKVSKDDLLKVVDNKLVNAILLNREGKIEFSPGYDGEYGVPLFDKQKKLGEF